MSKFLLATLFGIVMSLSTTNIAVAQDTEVMGTDPNTGGEAPGDAEAVEAIQSGMESQKEQWSGDAQRNAVENGQ